MTNVRALIEAKQRASRQIACLCGAMGAATLGLMCMPLGPVRWAWAAATVFGWLYGVWRHVRWWQSVLRAHDIGR